MKKIIVQGRVTAFILLLVLIVSIYLVEYLIRTGKRNITMRTLIPMQAISEAVGRCAEMGRPLFYSTGGGGGSISNTGRAGATIASINILGYTTMLCCQSGVTVKYFCQIADSLPLVEETLRNAYVLGGSPEDYDPNMIIYQSQAHAMNATYMGYVQRDKPAACILIGSHLYEAIVQGEIGNTVGAMQIGGSVSSYNLPFLVATCDYTLLMEEMYAAGAAISDDPTLLGSIAGGDMVKLLISAIFIFGFLLALVGNNVLINFLRM